MDQKVSAVLNQKESFQTMADQQRSSANGQSYTQEQVILGHYCRFAIKTMRRLTEGHTRAKEIEDGLKAHIKNIWARWVRKDITRPQLLDSVNNFVRDNSPSSNNVDVIRDFKKWYEREYELQQQRSNTANSIVSGSGPRPPEEEEPFWVKIEDIQNRFKEDFFRLMPVIQNIFERQSDVRGEQFMKHIQDCSDILKLRRSSSIPHQLTLNVLVKAEKFIAKVVTVYSKYVNDVDRNGVSRQGGRQMRTQCRRRPLLRAPLMRRLSGRNWRILRRNILRAFYDWNQFFKRFVILNHNHVESCL